MRKLHPFSCVLLVALLTVLGYFTWQLSFTYMRFQELQELRNEIYGEDGSKAPAPGELDGYLERAEDDITRYQGLEFKALKTELLLFKAWYFPGSSLDPLRQAIPLGMEVYGSDDFYVDISGWHVAWALGYAALPGRLDSWGNEVLVRAPYLRNRLLALQLEGLLQRDDAAGARALLQRELKQRPGSRDTTLLLIAGYSALGDYERAAGYAADDIDPAQLDVNEKLELADIRLWQGRFAEAEQLVQDAIEELPHDKELRITLAVARVGQSGKVDNDTLGLLQEAGNSVRWPTSLAGAKATLFSRLYYYTGGPQWVTNLLALAEENPGDFTVAAEVAHATLVQAANGPGTAAKGNSGLPVELPAPVPASQRALELAEEQWQRQEAHLLAFEALTVFSEDLGPAPLLEQSASHLRAALGDPALEDAVVSERVPDYASYLQAESVVRARQRWPDYNLAVHEAVIDYLNRRVELFDAIPQLKPLDKLDYNVPYTNGGGAADTPTAL